jgi:hypothetical protein
MNSCVTLWVGERLGPIERACLKSVVRSGNRLALYCFAEPSGVPEGVELRDAAEVLQLKDMLEVSGGRADLYSDWFRYELMKRHEGLTWVDTDIYAVGVFDQKAPYLFGEQGAGIINTAVLRLPPDSPMLPGLLEPFIKRTTPRWMRKKHYYPMRLRELLTGKADLSKTPWGTTAPYALTTMARKCQLAHLAQPPERFYPVPFEQAHWLLDPEIKVEDVTGPGTVAIHLWNECIRKYKNEPAPPGSFLARLQEEGRS